MAILLRGLTRSFALLFAVVAVVAGTPTGCGGGGDARKTVTLGEGDLVQPTQPAPPPTHPKATTTSEKFLETCGSCHTLKAARANGVVGPNLDKVRPNANTVREWIRAGSVDGIMPAGLFTGRDARRVAAYVARVAGRP
jgi:mono/diheme cytochrome c family protein